jgi:hypothetical protein
MALDVSAGIKFQQMYSFETPIEDQPLNRLHTAPNRPFPWLSVEEKF